MSASRPPLEILAEIVRLCSGMAGEAPPGAPSARTLAKLSAVVARISEPKKVRPAKCPPDYVELSQQADPTGADKLTSRAIRHLSWEADIAIQPRFQEVALRPDRISARSIQGIMRSVHRRWETTKSTRSVGQLSVALTEYKGRNPLLEKWKSNLQCVLRDEGPADFAEDILRVEKTWEAVAEDWGIEADTEFGQAVLRGCVAHALKLGHNNSERLQATVVEGILPSRHWSPDGLKNAVGQLLLACSLLAS